MEREITGKTRNQRSRKQRQESKVHEIMRRGCMNYLVELNNLSKLFGDATVDGIHPIEYLVKVNQWSLTLDYLQELDKHHTLNMEKYWR